MVALNEQFALKNPSPGSQNRVGDFFCEAADRVGTNRLPTPNCTRKNGLTVTIIVSGRPSFISRDPIGLSGGDVNLYAYVVNNPINNIDPSGLDYVGTIQYQSGALIYGYGTFEGRLYHDIDPTGAINVSGSLHGIGFQGGYITGEQEIRINADNPDEALGNQGGFFLADVGIGAGPINIGGLGGSINAYNGDNNADFGTPNGEISTPGISTTFDPKNPGSYLEKPRPGFGFSAGFFGIRVKKATGVESANNNNRPTDDSPEHN